MKQSIRKRSVICKEILLIFSAFFLPGMLFADPGIDAAAFERIIWHIGVLVTAIPQIVLMLYILELHPDHDPSRYGLYRLRALDTVRAAGVTLLILLTLVVTAVPIALFPGTAELLASEFRWQFSRPEILPLVLATSIAVGYREELFFRSYLLARLDDIGASRTAAVIGSTTLFAAGHIYQGISGFLLAAIIGLVLAAVYLRRPNLHVVAIAHGLYNVVALVGGSFLRGLPLD